MLYYIILCYTRHRFLVYIFTTEPVFSEGSELSDVYSVEHLLFIMNGQSDTAICRKLLSRSRYNNATVLLIASCYCPCCVITAAVYDGTAGCDQGRTFTILHANSHICSNSVTEVTVSQVGNLLTHLYNYIHYAVPSLLPIVHNRRHTTHFRTCALSLYKPEALITSVSVDLCI